MWDALWVQWGRVDPEGALVVFSEYPNKPRADARNLMAGWLETDPAGALAWAREPKETWLESVAAASAIIDSVAGEPAALRETMLTLPADSQVLKECVQDYLDLMALHDTESTPEMIYEELPPSLRQAAWTSTLDRLRVSDPQTAANWLETHAGDPGRDYAAARNLILGIAAEDPEGTVKWAAQLPADDHPAMSSHHPAVVAFSQWLNHDLPAANEWLREQPVDAPWRRMWGTRIGLEAE